MYKLAGVDLSRLGEASAAVLAAKPGASTSRRSATRFRGADDRYDGPIEISVKHHPAPSLKGVEVHEARLLPHHGRAKATLDAQVARDLRSLGGKLRLVGLA